MRIPIYIKEKLVRRAMLANQLNALDTEISKWLDKNQIDTEYKYMHLAILGEPETVLSETIDAIEEK